MKIKDAFCDCGEAKRLIEDGTYEDVENKKGNVCECGIPLWHVHCGICGGIVAMETKQGKIIDQR